MPTAALADPEFKEDLAEKLEEYIDINKSLVSTWSTLWEAMKVVARGEIISKAGGTRRQLRSELEAQEKEISRRESTSNITAEVEMKLKEAREKCQSSWDRLEKFDFATYTTRSHKESDKPGRLLAWLWAGVLRSRRYGTNPKAEKELNHRCWMAVEAPDGRRRTQKRHVQVFAGRHDGGPRQEQARGRGAEIPKVWHKPKGGEGIEPQTLHFTTPNGYEIYFDENGDGPSAYDILNVQVSRSDEFQLVKVGKLDPAAENGQDLMINTRAILWSGGSSQVPRSACSDPCSQGYREARRKGEPVCCFDCVPCSPGKITNSTYKCFKSPESQWPNERQDRCIQKVTEFLTFDEPFGLTLIISSIIMILFTASVFFVFINHRNTPIVKANNRGVSYVLLSTLMLCFLCSFIFISRPEQLTCMLRQTVFGIVFTVIVSSVLSKAVLVVLACKAIHPNSPVRKWLGMKTPFYIICTCPMVQIFICGAWLLRSPPFPELNLNSYNEKIIIECNEGDAIFFYCMLGYMGFLATVSFIVAFLSRNLPGSFNEAKLITFSMLVFVSVWLSFIPAYLSTRGKYMVAVEVFAILCSSAGLLGCIFLPKCYLISGRTDKNTRKYIVGKHLFNKKLEKHVLH
ncbi:vomeronasal type-2 receptor 26-like [Ambystoma mexicanum]|uniref:vomeronasal type-2 receptor 26-like n=1 Tax=Ambystoma mexicanum TaxID=8296 RepID=UPI0037E731FE